jgi:hypothetical protein
MAITLRAAPQIPTRLIDGALAAATTKQRCAVLIEPIAATSVFHQSLSIAN